MNSHTTKSRCLHRWGLAVASSVLLVALSASPAAASVFAGGATGDKTKSDTDGKCVWRSTLNPEPALQMDRCSWLDNALDAHDFDSDHGWTVSFASNLNGTIAIDEYYAWVTNKPTVTNRHGDTYGGGASGKIGGAVLDLNYDAGTGDPTGTSVHWIQVIRTNCPSDFGKNNGHDAGAGYYEYLDMAPNPGGNPYYDYTYAAGEDWFLDIPVRGCEAPCPTYCNWDAQVFLCTGDLTKKELTIYEEGVWWGFEFECDVVPEPSTIVIWSLLGLVGLTITWRRRCEAA